MSQPYPFLYKFPSGDMLFTDVNDLRVSLPHSGSDEYSFLIPGFLYFANRQNEDGFPFVMLVTLNTSNHMRVRIKSFESPGNPSAFDVDSLGFDADALAKFIDAIMVKKHAVPKS